MKVTRAAEAASYEPEEDWRRLSLCAEEDVSVEHFVKPPGHASPLHSHPNAQVLVVLDGALTIAVEGRAAAELAPGDAVYIAADEPHVVRNPLDRPSVGLDIFVPGRSFDFWLRRQNG